MTANSSQTGCKEQVDHGQPQCRYLLMLRGHKRHSSIMKGIILGLKRKYILKSGISAPCPEKGQSYQEQHYLSFYQQYLTHHEGLVVQSIISLTKSVVEVLLLILTVLTKSIVVIFFA